MAQKKIGLSSNSPLRYLGTDQNTVPVSYFSRIPTSDDKNFPIGQIVVLNESPSTGTEGDVYCLSKISGGSASWVKLNAEEVAAPAPFAGSGIMDADITTENPALQYFGAIQTTADGNTGITNGFAAGGLMLMPFAVDQEFTCTELRMNVTSFTTGGDLHFGLYSTTNGVPTSLHADFGTATITTTGNVEISFDATTIASGFYFIAYVLDNASSSANFNIRTMVTSAYYSNTNTSSTGTACFRVLGNSYTELPASVPLADLEIITTRMKIGLKP